MRNAKHDFTGEKVGTLTVIRQIEDRVYKNGASDSQWECVCDCDKNKICIKTGQYLKKSPNPSCGCVRNNVCAELGKSSKKSNIYNLDGECGVGYCTNTGTEFCFDKEDYDKIKDYAWMEHTNKDGYKSLRTSVVENGKKRAIKMSEIILGFKRCDHEDKNPFNNRKENLRKATTRENNRNRGRRSDNKSGYIGVWLDKEINKYRAYIRVNGDLLTIGYYYDKKDAIVASLRAEKEYFGDFAPQKDLFDEFGIV